MLDLVNGHISICENVRSVIVPICKMNIRDPHGKKFVSQGATPPVLLSPHWNIGEETASQSGRSHGCSACGRQFDEQNARSPGVPARHRLMGDNSRRPKKGSIPPPFVPALSQGAMLACRDTQPAAQVPLPKWRFLHHAE